MIGVGGYYLQSQDKYDSRQLFNGIYLNELMLPTYLYTFQTR